MIHVVRPSISSFNLFPPCLPIIFSPSYCSQEWRISIVVELTWSVALLGQQRDSTVATLTSECIAEPLPENTGSILMTSPTPTLSFFFLSEEEGFPVNVEKNMVKVVGWQCEKAQTGTHVREGILLHILYFYHQLFSKSSQRFVALPSGFFCVGMEMRDTLEWRLGPNRSVRILL